MDHNDMNAQTGSVKPAFRNSASQGRAWALVRTLSPALLCLALMPMRAGADSHTAELVRREVPEADRQRIEQAIPRTPWVRPARPRRVLIYDGNVNYGGHPSRFRANYAFYRMGKLTGAFDVTVSRDIQVFQAESLREFDAVFLNNTVGNLFTDTKLRRNLAEFVVGGGGLLGVHGTSVAFTRWPGAHEDWPEFAYMIGARGANHRDSDEHVFIKLDDPQHPINRVFAGHGFDYRDEFFRVHEPYSRQRLRVLFSIDTARTDFTQGGPPRGQCHRDDNDYALAWVRQYGRGRVFYCTIAHNPYVFWDARMLRFYLAAIQFACGDLPEWTTPSARLDAGARAREQLGWRLGLAVSDSPGESLFDSLDQAAQLGLCAVELKAGQRVSRDMTKPFSPQLNAREVERIRLKMAAAAVWPVTCELPPDTRHPEILDRWFDLGRRVGVEVFIWQPSDASIEPAVALAEKHNVKLALRIPRSAAAAAHDHSLASCVQHCQQAGPRVGLVLDLADCLRNGCDPRETIETMNDQLFVLRLGARSSSFPHERDKAQAAQASGQDWTAILENLRRLGLAPRLISFGHGGSVPTDGQSLRNALAVINTICIQCAAKSGPSPADATLP